MAGKFHLYADFAEKAESDLELAQHVATLCLRGHHGGPRRPGHALGTCMYHAQQALEKRLKSLVLLLDEILGATHDDVDAFLAKCINHPIYPAMHGYYSARLGLLRPAGHAPAAPGSVEPSLRPLSDFWGQYSGNYPLRLISWKHSVGLCLERKERQDLDSRHRTYAGLLAGMAGQDALDPSPLARRPEKLLPHECLDADALGRRRAEHAAGDRDSWLPATLDREFRKCQTAARILDDGSRTSRDARIRTARRAVLEFGVVLLVRHSVPYMSLLPHNTLGRYPQGVGDLTTTDLYGKQADHILHHLFVGVPHSMGQLSDYSGRIGSLWEDLAGP